MIARLRAMIEPGFGYYCNHCMKDVDGDVKVYLDYMSQLQRTVTVGVRVMCPECEMTLDDDTATVDFRK